MLLSKTGRVFPALTIIMVLLWAFPGFASAQTLPPVIQARAAVLMDASSGRVLYAKEAGTRLPEASLTKITTAIVALENGRLTEQIRVDQEAAETPESSIWLSEGEVFSLDDLLYALMLQSANDAAAAIAKEVGGTQENFVGLMNRRAAELGALNTNFVNPHGLDDLRHYTTAYDLALLTRHALTLPDFRRIVATPRKSLPWVGYPWDRVLYNQNRLLVGPEAYSGAIGVKTGYTRKAGNCLVGAAQRGDWELIAVVLNSPGMYQEVKSLLDYGFSNFSSRRLVNSNQRLASLPVSRGKVDSLAVHPQAELAVAISPGEEQRLRTSLILPERIDAPIQKGEVVGKLVALLDQTQVAEIPLVAECTVPRRTYWSYFLEAILAVFSL